ncbi:ABC transporter permease subunit [Bacillus sp. SCS-153A]|uniref:ABC transporter permease subunit n=1 Tax=Rossellomorea sedimentorum TaxID=3115294 RepID=UPI003906D2FB
MFSKDSWKYIVWVPMLIPHFIGAYIIYSFWAQPGLISSLAYELDFIDSMQEFPVLTSNEYYSGVILSYIWKETPFVVLMLLPVYQEIDKRRNDVVRTLGGGTWSVFKTVEWPWVLPVLAETGIILISFIMFAFEIPALLGVTYPKMLAILAYQWFYEGDWSMRPHAQAIMIFMTFFLLLFTYAIFHFIRKQQRYLKRSNTS